MAERYKTIPARSQRLTLAKLTPPDWYGWACVLAMFLLLAVRIPSASGVWFFPLLSLGEWLLLPLGVLSLSMGFLSLSRIREKTLLPLWISAIVPGLLWLAAVGLSILVNSSGPAGGDLMLSWAVHLIFPSMAFLPLFTMRVWRDRLMWALFMGVAANTVMIFWQGQTAGYIPPSLDLLGLGGLLTNQHDFSLHIGIALPLLAAWRGGDRGRKALSTLLCTFLLPALALSACYSLPGILAAMTGLVVAWAAWRSYAWILGIFLCLLLFGQGERNLRRDTNQRQLYANSAVMCRDNYQMALNTFQVRPYLGTGPEKFIAGSGYEPVDTCNPSPWYATLLGGAGVLGLGMWIVLLGEVAARTMGRFGRRCLWHGGVLGGVIALGISGMWTDSLPEGAGAMVGLLIALSILEEPEPPPPAKKRRRRTGNTGDDSPAPIPASATSPSTPQPDGEPAPRSPHDTDIIPAPKR